MGELHLDIKVDILKRTHKVEVNVGAPQVAYREKATRAVEHDYTHKKQSGGTGQFARIKFILEPNETGKASSSNPRSSAARFRRNTSRCHEGSGIGSRFRHHRRLPLVDIKVTLIDGAYHEVDSSALAFEIAARAGLREALQKAGCVLLEPVMKVEVVTPEEYTGSVIGDLNSARSDPGQDMRGNANVVSAMVPLANMFGYVNNLRSFSQGRASYTMQFDHYAEVPRKRGRENPGKIRLITRSPGMVS